MKLNVLTFNIFGRPNVYFKDSQDKRTKLMPTAIKDLERSLQVRFDVIMFQEVFNDYGISCLSIKERDNLFKNITKGIKKLGFKYFTGRVRNKFCPLNGGAFIASRHKFLDTKMAYFKDTEPAIENVMAAKGICYGKINKEGHDIHLINYHLDSYKASSRKKQVEFTKLFLKEHDITNNIIIGGDWNIDYWGDEVHTVAEILDDFEPMEIVYEEGEFNQFSINYKTNDYIKRRGDIGHAKEKQKMLDFFLYKSDCVEEAESEVVKLQHKHTTRPIIYSTPNNIDFYPPNINKIKEVVYDLSDHYPVWGRFTFV